MRPIEAVVAEVTAKLERMGLSGESAELTFVDGELLRGPLLYVDWRQRGYVLDPARETSRFFHLEDVVHVRQLNGR